MSKQVIIVINDYGYINGGAAKIAITSAIGLANKGEDVVFFCGVGPMDRELESTVRKVYCLNQHDILSNPNRLEAATQGIWNRQAYRMLNRVLDLEKGKRIIVHIHGWSKALSSSIIRACSKHDVKPFISLHDYFSVCPNGGFYNYKSSKICNKNPMSVSCILCNCDSRNYLQKCWRIVRQLVQDRYIRFNRRCNFIYLSKYSLRMIERYLKSDNFLYLKNPVDSFEVSVKPENNELFMCVGRISSEKGTDLFCEAIKRAKLKGVVVGDGEKRDELESFYPQIEFTGWLNKEELSRFVSKTRVLVFPSKCPEVAPLIVPEFLHCGIPCVVPRQNAAQDYIIEGRNGIYFDAGDVESLTQALLQIDRKIDIFKIESLKDEYDFVEAMKAIYRKGYQDEC